MNDLQKLQVDAERAIKALKGPQLDTVISYLTALAEQDAHEAMHSPNVEDLYRKQGSYRRLAKLLDTFTGDRATIKKRSTLRL